MNTQELAKLAYKNLVEKVASDDYYDSVPFKQTIPFLMDKEYAQKELKWLDTDEGKKHWDRVHRYNHIGSSLASHALITAPMTAAGISAGMARGNTYGKGLAGAALGGALIGVPTALAVQGITTGVHHLGTAIGGTPLENRRTQVQWAAK